MDNRKNSRIGVKSVIYSFVINSLIYKAIEKIVIPKTKSSFFIRKNYAGNEVNLYGGIVTGSTLVTSNLPIFSIHDSKISRGLLISNSVSTFTGMLDDLDNGKSEGGEKVKGFKGHLSSLRKGKITTGILKIVGICSSSFITSYILTSKNESKYKYYYDYLLNAGLIASMANLHNLFDLRPGRCLKFSGFINLLLLFSNRKVKNIAVNNLSTILASMPSDLAEKTMLGDTGANALGSSVGVGIVNIKNRVLKTVIAVCIVILTLISEKVSFSKIIASNKVLEKIDNIGRIKH